MSDVKQVKVDNWGIYFLQRLKHFFNRTDYCDLTLQFQDNAQLKVHRLVLNACTEYFELLERTCEMYEDCLVMPEDLQADVVVPIVNFMYTGQLEFRMDALERLYLTSQIMNMPVLSKLLEAHRTNQTKGSSHGYGSVRKFNKGHEVSRHSKFSSSTPSTSAKRSYSKAFESHNTSLNNKSSEQRKTTISKPVDKNAANPNSNEVIIYRDKKIYLPLNKQNHKATDRVPSPIPLDNSLYNKKLVLGEPRPTRYELPEELDTDNVFDNSFTNISYTSQPLMVHPETTKQYSAKKSMNALNEPSSSKKSFRNTVDIVECKKISNKNDSIFEDDQNTPDDDIYQSAFLRMKDDSPKDPGQLFDQILDNNDGPKVTIEAKDKQASNLDHAKIISEVLKRYPHLVKSNKNIKLKILNTPAKGKKTRPPTVQVEEMKEKSDVSYTYETDVLNSKEAAKLISLGAENIKGPWICLICGTPGRALNFTSYYNFRRHLVEVHKEKPVSNICEHCGLKSFKRNYLLHHIYTKHGVPPPPQYHFPKCNQCDYVALTEGFLVKHKLTHGEIKMTTRCLVCAQAFSSTNQMLLHIQKSGHKQQVPSADKKPSIQCTYCMKVFLRDNNFYCHLKTSHKEQALRDGVIEDSDDEKQNEDKPNIVHEMKPNIKHEHSAFENELDEDNSIEYPIQKRHDVHVHKKPRVTINSCQKILNTGYSTQVAKQSQKSKIISDVNTEFIQDIESSAQCSEENIVVINDVEYIVKDNQFIPRKSNTKQTANDEYIISDYMQDDENTQRLHNLENVTPSTSMEITDMHSAEIVQQPKMLLKKTASLNQPIQIVVSNEEEYKALMASNHSIIFDDGDPNKTLTVLTAPQNTALDTAGIDLDNTQTNDMMIIQENYPLNVSEAVSGDNSKYVVVYSHAMDHDDPNKQYQIITPQEIGTQYVQNSAVLTQNFDTITTTAPVVSANVIGPEIEQSWPQNDQHTVDNQTAILVAREDQLQAITETEQTNAKQNDDVHHLVNLPETEILRIPSKATLAQLQQQCNIIPNIRSEQLVVEENQTNVMEEHAMDIDIPAEVETEKGNAIVDETQITAQHKIEAVCQDEMSIENIPQDPTEVTLPEQEQLEAGLPIQEQQEEPLLEQHILSPTNQEQSGISIQEENSEATVVEENLNTDNIEPDNVNTVEEIPKIQENYSMQAENEKQPIVETREQIDNLTSEWSEDEYDSVLEESETNKNQTISENRNSITEEPELEESIENIQHEVHRQICDTNDTDLVASVESYPSKNQDTPSVEETKEDEPNITTINNDEATQEKISSLLNDWEDNDSQEDNTSINENGEDNPAAAESLQSTETNLGANTDQIGDIETPKDDGKKDDKIKSLVSDWDEEEENKE